MKDPYEVLGVARNASEADIKKAFRSLAKKHHPDAAAPSQQAAAQKAFQDISAAYEILGDKQKRAEFDAGRVHMGGGGGGFEGYPFGNRRPEDMHFAWGSGGGGGTNEQGFRPEDLFADLLGGMGGFKGRRRGGRAGLDVTMALSVGFTEAMQGGTRRLRLPDGSEIEVKLPPGLKDGQQIRLKGRGQPGFHGGPPGDLLLQLTVSADGRFTRDGRDLKCDLAISLQEAVLGAKVPVETLSGTVQLTVPAGSNSGAQLRLKGKGIPAHDGEPAGDMYVRLLVSLPEGGDGDLKRFVEGWKRAYDPRRR